MRVASPALSTRVRPFAQSFNFRPIAALVLGAVVCFAPACEGAPHAARSADAARTASAEATHPPPVRAVDTACTGGTTAQGQSYPPPPSAVYGELFRDVQLSGMFADSKTFPDMLADAAPSQILAAYRSARVRPDFDLRAFVSRHFRLPTRPATTFRSDPRQGVAQHVDKLWQVLLRHPDPAPVAGSSRLPLDYPYVVPGGRFDEIYYWDSYFIMLGLEHSGRHDLAVDELENFASLIRRYGHVPNGNRSYYLSRSQPPFFSLMVDLAAARDGDTVYTRYRTELEREYAYWMDGADKLSPGSAWRRVVRTRDGALLNRYWDDCAMPRDESYREDVATAARARRPAPEVYRNLRAGAESGWDFSSRWFAAPDDLATIRITSLAPVDLNSLLFHLERTLAKAYRLAGDARGARTFEQRAQARATALDRLMWDARLKAYSDYDFVSGTRTGRLSAATVYPLYFGLASHAQAAAVAASVQRDLLEPGGIATTPNVTGQQWDAPNGWAPLQYLAVMGFRRYGEDRLAATVARRWIAKNLAVYRHSGKLVEKYDVRVARAAGGGEYPLQDGFGWTNGVLAALLDLYPLPAVVSHGGEPAHASGPLNAVGR